MKTTTKKTFSYFFRQAKRYKFTGLTLLISVILGVALDSISPYFYKLFFDAVSGGNITNDTYAYLFKIILIVLGLNFGNWFFWRIVVICSIYFEGRIMRDIYNECFEYLHQHSYSFFNNNFVGSLVKRVNRLVSAFEGIIDKVIFEVMPTVVRTLIAVGMLFWTNQLIGTIFLIWIIIFIAINYFFAVYKLKFDVIKASADSKITGVLADTVSNHLNIKLFAGLRYELNEFKKTTNSWFKKSSTSWHLDNLMEAIQGLLMIALEFFIFWTAIKFWIKGMLTAGDLILIQSYIFAVFVFLWQIGRVIRRFYSDIANAEEMIVILNTPHEIKDSPYAKKLIVRRGEIEFKNVTFAYKNGAKVFDDLSFKIKPGEKVALVGLSGEGKSTAVNLLLRFFDIDQGQILIDGQDIKKVTLDSLRQKISLVPQEAVLFHRSLRDNIIYGDLGAKKEQIINAAKLAYCDEFISKMPQKYETFVGERGVKLSGGQRQRVAIARAILRNAPILILDEATSSLDSYAEKLIQKALRNLMQNKTALVIAHRLSTISQMDRILVIQKGKIIEEGTHQQLILNKESLYKKLWKLQTEQVNEDLAVNPKKKRKSRISIAEEIEADEEEILNPNI